MGDGLDEIVVVPSAFLDAVANGDFVDVGGLKDISGDAVDEGGVGGGIVLAGTAEVLVQMNVKHPVQCVLDLPMGSVRSIACCGDISVEAMNRRVSGSA
jgi:hypothetical protein